MAVILSLIIFILLIPISSIRPTHSQLSLYELRRRSNDGDRESKRALKRERQIRDVISLKRSIVALLLVVFILLSTANFGWMIGIILSLLVAIEYGAVSEISFISRLSQRLYMSVEKHLLRFINKYQSAVKYIRSEPDINRDFSVGSVAELQYIINQSEGILTSDEKQLIVHGLSFSSQRVKTIMTPVEKIKYVKKSEFLGPLTLDELHKLGHDRLPVIDGDIDHIVGVLNIKNLLTLDIKRSTTAEKAMEPKVYYIRDDQSLYYALSALLATHHSLFIVVNESGQTVGLLVIEDIIEALIGRKIVNDFDEHDSLRAVVSQKNV